MKKFAKLLAMVLAVSMVLTMFVGAVDYKDAADIDEDKLEAVEAVYEAGIMMGNDKGEFNPTSHLTRDEMAKILFALASDEQKAEDYYGIVAAATFTDFDKIPNWSKSFVGYAASVDYILGNDKGEANALGNLSYVEAAIMLMRTLNLESTYEDGEDTVPSFTGSKWYQNAVLCAYQNGLFADLDITDFKTLITREDVAVMIYNAMGHDNAAAYALAAPMTATLTGVEVDEEEDVVYAIVNASNKIKVPMAAETVEAFIGLEITAVVEKDEMLDIVVNDPLYVGEVTIGDVAVEKVPTADEDDDEEALNDYFSLLVNDKVVLDNANVASKYLALGGADYVKFPGTIGTFFATEDDFQKVTLIVNENSVCVTYAPVEFFQFDNDLLVEDYDPDEKIYTGEYLYDGDAFPYGKLDVEDGTWCYKQVIDDTVADFGFVDVVSSADLDVAFNANAEDKYTVSYEGTELYNYANADKGNIWKDVMTKAEDMFAYIYNDEVLVAYALVAEEEADPTTEISYVIVTDYTASVATDKDDDDNTVYIWTTTIKALNLLGEEVEIVYEADAQADIDYVVPFGLAADKFFQVTTIDGEFDSMAIVADPTYVGLLIDVIGEDFDCDLLVNYTNLEVEFDDITVEEKNGRKVVKIGDSTIAGASLAVIDLNGATIVVFDPSYDFGVFADLID